MRRERAELHREIDRLYDMENAEVELGCGFGTTEITNTFAPLFEDLYEKLAKTYGRTIKEYEEMVFYSSAVAPFN